MCEAERYGMLEARPFYSRLVSWVSLRVATAAVEREASIEAAFLRSVFESGSILSIDQHWTVPLHESSREMLLRTDHSSRDQRYDNL